MDYRLYFNARDWSFNQECESNKGERAFVTGIDGKLIEVYSLGNWGWDWTEIVSKQLTLQKNTEYVFSFWLNGGENDRNNEVCQLQILFNSDIKSALTYKLNRTYIKPVKRYMGWELYEIAFTTSDNEYTQIKFVAQAAFMIVMPAKDKEEYADLADEVDEFDGVRPQRHNMIFDDGWPKNTWYSTMNLKKSGGKPNTQNDSNNSFGWNNNSSGFNSFTNVMNDGFKDRIKEIILDEIDIDDIVEQIDIDSIKEEIKQEIKNKI